MKKPSLQGERDRKSIGAVRKDRDGACALDRLRQLALMLCTGASHAAG